MMTRVPEIVTSAQGEAQFTPDRARIFIGVQTRAKSAQEAGAENARKQEAVIAAIQALGIPKERISTANYSVFPEQQFNPQQGDREPKIIGYNVQNTVRVDIHDISRIGAIIDAALSKGANNINSLDFYASNQDSTRRQALAEAVQRARGDAEALARAAGGQLGELIELSSAPVSIPRPPVPYMTMARAESVSATPVNPGEETLTVTVTARWKFVAGQ
ncbi:MAG TPA: SIMPL domain-containing protein [Gemmatimonadaceae bacterium]|nr:SIMPL domain-containing protein [Gemmatimonadaceae bacterium]